MATRLLAILGLSLLALLTMAADCKKADDESSDPSQAAHEATEPAPSAGTKTEPPSEAAAAPEAEDEAESPPKPGTASGAGTDEPAAEPTGDPSRQNPSITGRENEGEESDELEDLSAEEFTEKAERDIRIMSSQMGDYQSQLERLGDKVDPSFGERFVDNAEARNKMREQLEAFKKRSEPPKEKIKQMQERLQTLKADWMNLRKEIESDIRSLPASDQPK